MGPKNAVELLADDGGGAAARAAHRPSESSRSSAPWLACVLLGAVLCAGCGPLRLLGYALRPDVPVFDDGDEVALAGLREPVAVTRKADGLWRISAANEGDAMLAQGYLLARDRMAQLDLFRHLARGELAALIGNQVFGGKTALDIDRMNRFLGFRDRANALYERTSAAERAALDAFVRGINLWIAEGRLSLEHRLLGVDVVRPWTPTDSLAIYQMLMFGLSGNADREVRRLLIACEAGLDALDRIWPHDIEFAAIALPEEDLRPETYPRQPAVVPELAAQLPRLCLEGAADRHSVWERQAAPRRGVFPSANLAALVDLLRGRWSASNSWTVAGAHTRSGKPILSNDPHLPHMNPPMIWGVDVGFPGQRVAGFTLAGLHRVVFGHNGRVAWGATTNHVDRQDLVVHRSRSEVRDGRPLAGYEFEGEFAPFEYRTEVFEVKGGEPVRASVRFTRDGPLLNDLEPFVAGRIPLTALRVVPLGRGSDLDGARAIQRARSAEEFASGISLLDLGCSSWLFADAQGSIGFRSPCQVPVRFGWRGTFPVAGWLRRYEWRGFYPKDALPAAANPGRGWLAMANSQIVPSSRFPTTYTRDVSSPNRYLRIAARLRDAIGRRGLTAEASAAIQLDISYEHWAALREDLKAEFCDAGRRGEPELARLARDRLCEWNGAMAPDSVAPTLYTLWTHALLDRALADELPGGAQSETWRTVQSLLQFEANVAWLWSRPEDAPVWDDATTAAVEKRRDMFERAFRDAVATGRERFGNDLDAWSWGRVRPFVLRHPFGGANRLLGWLVDSEAFPIGGGNETLFKQQFPRSDREQMRPVVGPVVRFTVDLSEPWAARYTLAGGESGWPGSPFYGNLLDDWRRGRDRPLTPEPSSGDVNVTFVPAER
jgi:penicillin amidase